MSGTELATTRVQALPITEGDSIASPSPLPWMPRIEEHPQWEMLAQLRVTMRSGVALNRFRVRDLLAMKPGQVFESISPATEDVPVMIGQVQMGWSEFEAPGQRLSLRLTRLS